MYKRKKDYIEEIISTMHEEDLIITFNYTKTYDIYNPKCKILHIHGEISTGIIFGSYLQKEMSLFNKDAQKVYLGITNEVANLINDFEYWEKENPHIHKREPEIYIMGHSIDRNDYSIYDMLYNLMTKVTNSYTGHLLRSGKIAPFEILNEYQMLKLFCWYYDEDEVDYSRDKWTKIGNLQRLSKDMTKKLGDCGNISFINTYRK